MDLKQWALAAGKSVVIFYNYNLLNKSYLESLYSKTIDYALINYAKIIIISSPFIYQIKIVYPSMFYTSKFWFGVWLAFDHTFIGFLN